MRKDQIQKSKVSILIEKNTYYIVKRTNDNHKGKRRRLEVFSQIDIHSKKREHTVYEYKFLLPPNRVTYILAERFTNKIVKSNN